MKIKENIFDILGVVFAIGVLPLVILFVFLEYFIKKFEDWYFRAIGNVRKE